MLLKGSGLDPLLISSSLARRGRPSLLLPSFPPSSVHQIALSSNGAGCWLSPFSEVRGLGHPLMYTGQNFNKGILFYSPLCRVTEMQNIMVLEDACRPDGSWTRD